MKRNVIVLSVIFVLLSVGAVYYFFSKNKDKTYLWRTAKVDRGDVLITVTATGSINADTTVEVGTQVSGIIAKLMADFNSVVKKGQIIAILDTTLLAAAKEEALANVEKSIIQVKQSELEFNRSEKLFAEKVIAKADYDLALANFETAKKTFKLANAQLKRAQINIRYATIRAPVSGTVISRNVDIGQTVIASFNTPTLFTIANDLTKMQVQANVDEADIGQVRLGQEAVFTVDAYPEKIFKGLVRQIRLQPIIVQSVVTYIVIIDVPNPDLSLMPGLTANITIKILEHNDVLKIPNNALHFFPPKEYFTTVSLSDSIKRQTDDFKRPLISGYLNQTDSSVIVNVWVLKDNLIYKKNLNRGISDGAFVEVSGDIREGEEVVIGISNNMDNVDNGSAVKNPFMPKFSSKKK